MLRWVPNDFKLMAISKNDILFKILRMIGNYYMLLRTMTTKWNGIQKWIEQPLISFNILKSNHLIALLHEIHRPIILIKWQFFTILLWTMNSQRVVNTVFLSVITLLRFALHGLHEIPVLKFGRHEIPMLFPMCACLHQITAHISS